MKTCTRCGLDKNESEFNCPPSLKGRLKSQCKVCDVVCITQWQSKNRKWVNTRERNRRFRNPIQFRAANLRRTFGISLAQYAELLDSQGGVCAICRAKCKTGKPLSVDHVHGSNPVLIRGLLCSNCNCAIGQLKDSVEFLLRAIEYLKKPTLCFQNSPPLLG